jgi:hypothetical protein
MSSNWHRILSSNGHTPGDVASGVDTAYTLYHCPFKPCAEHRCTLAYQVCGKIGAGVTWRGRQYLTIEEAVYLIDRGSLLLVRHCSGKGDVPLSRQECYQLLVRHHPCTFARRLHARLVSENVAASHFRTSKVAPDHGSCCWFPDESAQIVCHPALYLLPTALAFPVAKVLHTMRRLMRA